MMARNPSKEQTEFAIPPIEDLLFAAGLGYIVVMAIMPMPDWFIDLTITVNQAAAILLLFMSIYPQQFTTIKRLPSMLILVSLGRLGIMIAACRNILAYAHGGDTITSLSN